MQPAEPPSRDSKPGRTLPPPARDRSGSCSHGKPPTARQPAKDAPSNRPLGTGVGNAAGQPPMQERDTKHVEWGSQTLRQVCPQEGPEGAMCVQNFNDSRGLAIRITYRISLRSSSLWEPRHPLLKVVLGLTEDSLGPHTPKPRY